MKTKLIRLALIGFLTIFSVTYGQADDGTIYISEPLIGDSGIYKTLISVFKPDGTQVKKIAIEGVMAKVSPDGKQVAYVERIEDGHAELALADATGKKIRNLPSLLNKKDKRFPTLNLSWSPDGKKIAVLQQAYDVALCVLFLETDELKTIYSMGRPESSEEGYAYSVKWLPDNKNIFLSGRGGTIIVDTNTKAITEISKDPITATVTDDGKKVVYIPKPSMFWRMIEPGPYDIWIYDIASKKREKIYSLDISPVMFIVSGNGKYLSFAYQSSNQMAVAYMDLLTKKLRTIETKDMAILPMKFSPRDNNMILSVGGSGKEEDSNFGIFNVKNGEFKKLMDAVEPSGEDALMLMILLNVEWR